LQLAFDPEVEEFRAEFAAFLDANLPAEADAMERPRSVSHMPDWARRWQRLLFDNGWLLPGQPPEFGGRADAYIDEVCDHMLPPLVREGLVDAVDAFCETIGFTPAQTERVFRAARALGVPVKLHAEQLSDQGGAALVARYGGLSADHLEYLSDAGIAAMAQAGTVAVLLPGAFYFLREKKLPPIDALRGASVPMAVATDCNPGTSPLTSLLLALNMACTLFRLTPAEALAGATVHAARALGLHDVGTLEVHQRADFVLWNIGRPADLAYAIGLNPCRSVVRAGGELRQRSHWR